MYIKGIEYRGLYTTCVSVNPFDPHLSTILEKRCSEGAIPLVGVSILEILQLPFVPRLAIPRRSVFLNLVVSPSNKMIGIEHVFWRLKGPKPKILIISVKAHVQTSIYILVQLTLADATVFTKLPDSTQEGRQVPLRFSWNSSHSFYSTVVPVGNEAESLTSFPPQTRAISSPKASLVFFFFIWLPIPRL